MVNGRQGELAEAQPLGDEGPRLYVDAWKIEPWCMGKFRLG